MWISKYFAGFHLQLDCLCVSFRRGLYLKVAWEYKPDPESKDRMPGKRCIHASMYVPAGRLQLHQANPLECANHHLFAAAVLQAISARLKRAGILGEEHGEMRSAARAKTPAGSARIGPQTQPRRPAGRARRNRGHLLQQRLRAQGAPRPPPLASRTAPPPRPCTQPPCTACAERRRGLVRQDGEGTVAYTKCLSSPYPGPDYAPLPATSACVPVACGPYCRCPPRRPPRPGPPPQAHHHSRPAVSPGRGRGTATAGSDGRPAGRAQPGGVFSPCGRGPASWPARPARDG